MCLSNKVGEKVSGALDENSWVSWFMTSFNIPPYIVSFDNSKSMKQKGRRWATFNELNCHFHLQSDMYLNVKSPATPDRTLSSPRPPLRSRTYQVSTSIHSTISSYVHHDRLQSVKGTQLHLSPTTQNLSLKTHTNRSYISDILWHRTLTHIPAHIKQHCSCTVCVNQCLNQFCWQATAQVAYTSAMPVKLYGL